MMWPLVALVGIGCATWLGHKWLSQPTELFKHIEDLRQRVGGVSAFAVDMEKGVSERNRTVSELSDRVSRLELEKGLHQ